MQGLLLAAGFSRRFGANKLMASYQGEWLAVAALRALAAAVDTVFAVVREDTPIFNQALAAAGAILVPCRDACLGMGASLACGARALDPTQPVIVALADMPGIQPGTHQAVAAALRQGALLCAPAYAGRRGHPVGFAARYLPELAQLAGDAGARDILHRDRAQLQLLPVDDPGVLFDVDTPADLG